MEPRDPWKRVEELEIEVSRLNGLVKHFDGVTERAEQNTQLMRKLADALKGAITTIGMWHGHVGWDIYRKHAPEMTRLHDVLDEANKSLNCSARQAFKPQEPGPTGMRLSDRTVETTAQVFQSKTGPMPVSKEAQDFQAKMYACEPPCNSFGKCSNCCDQDNFEVGYVMGYRAASTPTQDKNDG